MANAVFGVRFEKSVVKRPFIFTWVSSLFYRSTFSVNVTQPLHSYLCTDNWGHGFITINGFNIGRFTEKGPQRTLYVPAHILKQGINEILVFESDRQQTLKERNMTFIDHHLWTN